MIRHQAFSLVELVIVVVIIGMISAIAVPRVTDAASGTRDAALRGNLATLRGAIDLYTAEHGGTWPGADGLAQSLIDQLAKKTDTNGNIGTTPGLHIFGPYLRSGFPPLPLGTNSGGQGVIMTDVANLTAEIDDVDETTGWVYNYEIGKIIANTVAIDKDGTPYSSY